MMTENSLYANSKMVSFVKALLKKTKDQVILWDRSAEGYKCPFSNRRHDKKWINLETLEQETGTAYFIYFTTDEGIEYKMFYCVEGTEEEEEKKVVETLEELLKAILKNIDDQFLEDINFFLGK